MTKRAKAWSYGVAYLSLTIGAGVSVAGNVADTHRIAAGQGRTPDGLDLFIAGFWPAAVLLVIEMFVSRLWPQRRGPQLIRWTASITFGFIAAFMSWIHLSDLLASRAQGVTVATLGPLAIDGLAIMATALILAAREHRLSATPDPWTPDNAAARLSALPDPQLSYALSAVDNPEADMSEPSFSATWGQAGREASPVDMSSVSIWERLDSDLDRPASVLPAPVSPAPSGSARLDRIPSDAQDTIVAWLSAAESDRPSPADVDKLVASGWGVSTKTAYRWRTALRIHHNAAARVSIRP